jgi:hypothetical protein
MTKYFYYFMTLAILAVMVIACIVILQAGAREATFNLDVPRFVVPPSVWL